MRLLLDTHTVVWWWTDNKRLPPRARAAIADPEASIHVSAVSALEINMKFRLGKWPELGTIVDGWDGLIRRSRFLHLPMATAHAALAGSMDWAHRDPFDRILLAQARVEDAVLVSGDTVFRIDGTAVLWD